ncbi:Protein of unknown function [Marinobacter gudaonensis]|uniref:DUF2868 domain-containing protein n=1 Tax=Marinobacter gudaonensis TaxID=375760 RepID=A0A1I6H2Q7_9GAMM|nr:DUF2868 domain-containing protein [Marinobacter gudaonensis]SFR48739.1 Protein of unknown function [Marinobacter gudaonensis]
MTERPLRLLLDFDHQAQRDRSQPPAFLHRRDRKFALLCREQGVVPDAARWLSHLQRLSGPEAAPTPAEQTLSSWRRITGGFAAAGAITGILTMSGLLFYEGGQRINITVLLAFVLLHLALALATTVQAMAGWQPWRRLLRRVGKTAGEGAFRQLQPLLMARAAHLGGLCFALTGLATLLTLVVIQDLAFGWSTTLDTAATGYHRLIRAIAAPWAWLWPAAVPDLALVEATRFFRAGEGNGIQPGLWGQWWPFVTMLWSAWVVLPRLLLWLLMSRQLQRRARDLLTSHPAMHALRYRMETATLETGNAHNDAHDLPDTRTRSNLLPLPDSDVLLCWAGAGEPELPDALRAGKGLVVRAGGRSSLAGDEEALRAIEAQLNGRADAIILLVRSWEPPTGELEDLLESARRIWPDGTSVALVPLAADAHREPAPHQIQPWLRFAEKIGGDFLRVSLPPMSEPSPYAGKDRAL